MRKAGLPLHWLLTDSASAGDARRPALPGRHGAVRRDRREPRVGGQRRPAIMVRPRRRRRRRLRTSPSIVDPGAGFRRPGTPAGRSGIVVDGDDDVWVSSPAARRSRATRCSGFVARAARGLGAPHRTASTSRRCAREPDRIVPVTWSPRATSVFLVNIQVEALDRSRLLSGRHPRAVRTSTSTSLSRRSVAPPATASRWRFTFG